MFNSVFERITYLEYQLKAKNDIIASFESEERYVINAGGIPPQLTAFGKPG